jgi:hypothetical protein
MDDSRMVERATLDLFSGPHAQSYGESESAESLEFLTSVRQLSALLFHINKIETCAADTSVDFVARQRWSLS